MNVCMQTADTYCVSTVPQCGISVSRMCFHFKTVPTLGSLVVIATLHVTSMTSSSARQQKGGKQQQRNACTQWITLRGCFFDDAQNLENSVNSITSMLCFDYVVVPASLHRDPSRAGTKKTRPATRIQVMETQKGRVESSRYHTVKRHNS